MADRWVIVRDATGRVTFSNEDHSCWVHDVAFSPDGRYVSTGTGIGPEGPARFRQRGWDVEPLRYDDLRET